jgi:hypothetical protein
MADSPAWWCAMALRLLPWAPEFGAGLEAEVDGATPPPSAVDTRIELTEWRAVTPAAPAPDSLRIVDGVRRVEAHAMEEAPADARVARGGDEGEPALGLFGSFAVGAVALDAGSLARIDESTIRLERCYLQTGGEPTERAIAAGRAELRYRPRVAHDATTPRDLVAALNRAMLDEEALLAAKLAEDEDALVLVDGPLRPRLRGRRSVGYVKRIHQWYVGTRERALAVALEVGQRTPLFHIEGDAGAARYSWYARTASLPGLFHPLTGVVRMECAGTLPIAEAARLADEATMALPRLASTPVRDPRAPQNLLPVGGLERALTHRLGDRRWMRRLLTASFAGGGVDASAERIAIAAEVPA